MLDFGDEGLYSLYQLTSPLNISTSGRALANKTGEASLALPVEIVIGIFLRFRSFLDENISHPYLISPTPLLLFTLGLG